MLTIDRNTELSGKEPSYPLKQKIFWTTKDNHPSNFSVSNKCGSHYPTTIKTFISRTLYFKKSKFGHY